jgi:HEPN domain-containing protein
MRKATREWVRKAEDDHRAAVMLAEEPDPLPDQVCFHCQQSAEKYLKGLLEELGLPIPKIHDLESLLALLAAHHSKLRPLKRGLLFLTDFAVDTRYPGNRTTKRQAASALRWAGKVREACRALLGIRPTKGRK